VDQEAVTRATTAAALVLLAAACKKPPPEEEPPPPVIASATATLPPVALSGVAPVSAFADAAPPDGQTPYDQARAYEANGQLWLARLVLEKKALGSDGTKQELELLATICHEQGDDSCVAECSKKLGKKLKFDGGAPRHKIDPGEHREPETDTARARDFALKGQHKEAREILEPKVLGGKASKAEIRLLRNVCREQGDRMCVALCDTKLK
jgi:hypothetical protein